MPKKAQDKQEKKQKKEPVFYAAVAALAQFVEQADKNPSGLKEAK